MLEMWLAVSMFHNKAPTSVAGYLRGCKKTSVIDEIVGVSGDPGELP
jgi:hypothetical protein